MPHQCLFNNQLWVVNTSKIIKLLLQQMISYYKAKHHSFNHKNFNQLIHTRNGKSSYKDNLLLSKWDKTWTKSIGKKSTKDSQNSCSILLILKTNKEKSSKFNNFRQTKTCKFRISNNLAKNNNNYPWKILHMLKHIKSQCHNKPTSNWVKNPQLLSNSKKI